MRSLPATAQPAAGARGTLDQWLPRALPVAAAILMGVVASCLSTHEPKWVLYTSVGQLWMLAALLTGLRSWLLITYVMALQLNARYWITKPPPYLAVGQSGETAIFIALVSLPAMALILHDLTRNPEQMRKASLATVGRACLPAAGLILATALSAATSTARFQSVCTLIELLQFALVFLAAAMCIRSRDDVELVFQLLVATMAIQSVIYFTQAYLGITFNAVGRVIRAGERGLIRPGGTVSSVPACFAAFMEPLIFMTTAAFLTARATLLRRGYMLLLVVAMGAVLLTLNRTTWLGVPIGLATVFLLGIHTKKIRSHRVLSAGAMMFVAACAAIVAAPMTARRLSVQDFALDWQTRLSLVFPALKMIRDHLTLGVGPGAYAYHLPQYTSTDGGWVYVVHNEYLMIWADIGTLGMLAWCVWFGSGIRRGLRCIRLTNASAASMSLGITAALLVRTWDWMWWSHYAFSPDALLWFLFGLLVALERQSGVRGGNPHSKPWPQGGKIIVRG